MAVHIKRDSILGIIFFGGLLLLLYATYALGAFSLGAKETIHVEFPNARGIKIGDSVLVLGKRTGIVREVDFEPTEVDRPIHLLLELDQGLTFHEGYRISIEDASLLGGKLVAIDPGPPRAAALRPGEALLGRALPNPLEALGQLIGDEKNRRRISSVLDSFNTILTDFRHGTGPIGDALAKVRDFFAKAEEVAGRYGDIATDVRSGRGRLGRVVTKAGDFLARADEIATTIRDGRGLVARLLRDEALADKVGRTVDHLESFSRDLEEGEGPLPKLLHDEGWAGAVSGILGDLQAAGKALNDPKGGLLAAALHDPELRENLTGTAADVRGIVADLRAGKGTIGQLLADDTLIRDARKILDQIRGAIEDAREAAPVSTFVTVFTGSFQ